MSLWEAFLWRWSESIRQRNLYDCGYYIDLVYLQILIDCYIIIFFSGDKLLYVTLECSKTHLYKRITFTNQYEKLYLTSIVKLIYSNGNNWADFKKS